jgi:hypothetical protein
MASFSRKKEKRLSESKYNALAESHVPCFQERVGTSHPGYMIPDRLPWRLRARPSATLHEIQVRSEERTCCGDGIEPSDAASSGKFRRKFINHERQEVSRRKSGGSMKLQAGVEITRKKSVALSGTARRFWGSVLANSAGCGVYPPPPWSIGIIDMRGRIYT